MGKKYRFLDFKKINLHCPGEIDKREPGGRETIKGIIDQLKQQAFSQHGCKVAKRLGEGTNQ